MSKKEKKSDVDPNAKARAALFHELLPIALAKTLEHPATFGFGEGQIAARVIEIAKAVSEQVHPGPIQGLGTEE